jgi:hypothetical protein
MAANGGQSGLGAELARQAADRMHGAASWLERREPADLLDEVRNFARRRPGAFLIGAAVAGLAAGRLTRGLTAGGQSQQGQRQQDAWADTSAGLPAASPVDLASEPGVTYPAADPFYPAADPFDPAVPTYPADPAAGAGAGYPPVTEPIEPTAPAYPADEGLGQP